MGKYLTITRTGYKGDKVFETTARMTEDIYNQSPKDGNYLNLYNNFVIKDLDKITWIFWEMYRFEKDSDMNVKKFSELIDKYFK